MVQVWFLAQLRPIFFIVWPHKRAKKQIQVQLALLFLQNDLNMKDSQYIMNCCSGKIITSRSYTLKSVLVQMSNYMSPYQIGRYWWFLLFFFFFSKPGESKNTGILSVFPKNIQLLHDKTRIYPSCFDLSLEPSPVQIFKDSSCDYLLFRYIHSFSLYLSSSLILSLYS